MRIECLYMLDCMEYAANIDRDGISYTLLYVNSAGPRIGQTEPKSVPGTRPFGFPSLLVAVDYD